MIVNFICRGNTFRSILAEAYTNSLRIDGIHAISSGIEGAAHREENAPGFAEILDFLEARGLKQYAKDHHGDQLDQPRLDNSDLVVCLNGDVYLECRELYAPPNTTVVWDVADLGERGVAYDTLEQRTAIREAALAEIAERVDRLVGTVALSKNQ
jgi:protein-tyrosine-phosphatase